MLLGCLNLQKFMEGGDVGGTGGPRENGGSVGDHRLMLMSGSLGPIWVDPQPQDRLTAAHVQVGNRCLSTTRRSWEEARSRPLPTFACLASQASESGADQDMNTSRLAGAVRKINRFKIVQQLCVRTSRESG